MKLIQDPYEITSAVTDLIITAMAIAGVLVALTSPQWPSLTSVLWMSLFATLAISSFWGAVIHGFTWLEVQRKRLWIPLHVALAILVALLVTCGSASALGEDAAKQWLIGLLPVALAFSLYLVLKATSFIPFTIYQAIGCLLALSLFGLAIYRGGDGALWQTLGVLVIALSAGVQGLAPLQVKWIWPLDHNGVYHLAQMPGLIMLIWGAHLHLVTATTA